MNVLLKAAKIIDPANTQLHGKKRDILVRNGILEKIAPALETPPKTREVSLANLHISPGWFDSSISFGEPGYEERETIANGLRTASKSGFTDLVLNPDTHPVPDSSSDIVFLKNAGANQVATLYPLGSLTVKSQGEDLAELFDMHKAGAVGFYDYKKPLRNANLLKIALQYASNFGGLVYSFPQEGHIAGKGVMHEGKTSVRLGLKGIPALAEELQVSRDLFILEYTGGSLHIPTISTAGSVKLIAAAKRKGLDVSCSVALHNLFTTDEALEDFDTNFKTLPPLRTRSHTQALLKGLKDGTIDYVTSDHCPVDIEEKRVEFDNAGYGTLGLESAFGALLTLVDLNTVISLLLKGRERFRIPRPEIREGAQANLSLFDPDVEYVFSAEHIHSTSRNSLFLNARLKGKVYGSLGRGQLILAS